MQSLLGRKTGQETLQLNGYMYMFLYLYRHARSYQQILAPATTYMKHKKKIPVLIVINLFGGFCGGGLNVHILRKIYD